MERVYETRGKYFRDVEYRVNPVNNAEMNEILQRNDPYQSILEERKIDEKLAGLKISEEERAKRKELMLLAAQGSTNWSLFLVENYLKGAWNLKQSGFKGTDIGICGRLSSLQKGF